MTSSATDVTTGRATDSSSSTGATADNTGAVSDTGVRRPDVGTGEVSCPEDGYIATNPASCGDVGYVRDGGLLTLNVGLSRPLLLTDPDVEVLYSSAQPGYEGIVTLARELSVPDVFYMRIGDDDFMQAAEQNVCSLPAGECEADCVEGPGGDVCRAFVDDFIPMVADDYIGTPIMRESFGRREAPAGECCDAMLGCNNSVTTFAEYVVSGPLGTMHFVFEDAFAFADTMGWDYEEVALVEGEGFEIDLCELPVVD